MNAQVQRIDLNEVARAWSALREKTGIGPIRDEKHYLELVDLLNELLDEVRDDEKHPLADFLEVVGEIISGFETGHHPVSNLPPREVLRYLMQEHKLTQSDLPEAGSQGVISEILAGKREINARQAKALAARFGTKASVFVSEE